MIGPRIYATGPGIFWLRQRDERRRRARRHEALLGVLPHADDQAVHGRRPHGSGSGSSMAAKEQRITPTLEGGLDFKKNLTEAIDGYAGIEHSLPDRAAVQGRRAAVRQERHDVHADAARAVRRPVGRELLVRALRHPERREARALHAVRGARAPRRCGGRSGSGTSEYSFKLFAEQAKKIVEAGGRVGVGGHGQLQGLGVHWELWTIASGGMKPMDALRVGDDLRRRGDRAGEAPRLARGGEARRPRRARRESARGHQEHEHDSLRDEERPAVRRQHARRGVAAAAPDAEAVVDDARRVDA